MLKRWRVSLQTTHGILASQMDEQALSAVTEGVRFVFGEEDFREATASGLAPGGEGRIKVVVELAAASAGVAAAVAVERVELVLREEYRHGNIGAADAAVERVEVSRAPVGDEWNP